MQVVDLITEFLKNHKVKHVFGYQGGGILPLIHSICKSDSIDYVQTYHEQAAGFAADGYARITENLGVALATNGPGATNLVSAIANSYFDFSPCIFFTGQVNTFDINKVANVRQNGFQEIDTVSLVKDITKYAVRIEKESEILNELQKAYKIATTAPKGPVLIDLPLNIQKAEIDENLLKSHNVYSEVNNLSQKSINKFIEMLSNSVRPVVVAGGGIKLSGAQKEFAEFIEKTNIPRVSTLNGLDVYSKNNFGFCGLYGLNEANLAINKSDLLIIFGSRLSKRQIGIKDKYAPNAKIIQIDVNTDELGRVLENELSINADIKNFLSYLLQKLNSENLKNYNGWLEEIINLKQKYSSKIEYNNKDVRPVEFVKTVSNYISDSANIIFDVGQNQMWCAQALHVKKRQSIISSGGLGCMGFSLPAAVGAYYANGNQTIAFMGDGGLQMNLQELQLVSQNKLPIKIVVFNNTSLGMIQEVQMKFANKEYFGTKIGYSTVNLEKLANCYDINFVSIKNQNDIKTLEEKFKDNNSYIVEIVMTETPTRLQTQYDEVKEYEN
ncbi:thiamine pyrophosphate-binding protein [bacterium]|nr:thiamine pyrophosphate-binding protein [bacterium]